MTIASHVVKKENGDDLVITIEPREETVRIALCDEMRNPRCQNIIWIDVTHQDFSAMLAKVGYMNIDAIAVRVQERMQKDAR